MKFLRNCLQHWVGVTCLVESRQTEKHFSVGRFDKEYVKTSGVGVVRKDQQVVGFVTAQPMTQRTQAGYDLLRVLPGEPVALSDYLLANLFVVYQKQGYLGSKSWSSTFGERWRNRFFIYSRKNDEHRL